MNTMWLKWLPWKYIIGRLARSHGFTDPIAILSHIRRFSQPSEVNEPIELLRAGVVFHARGLVNSRVIQHNLDWVWPYWVNEQFDPERETFVPRAISLTHINLSGRNWTAIGLPGVNEFPIVDPRGTLMPFWDSWSIDAWIATSDNRLLAPSRLKQVEQKLDLNDSLCIQTSSQIEGASLQSRAWVEKINDDVQCLLDVRARTDSPGQLIVALRPYNPEGVSFIHNIAFDPEQHTWTVNEDKKVFLDAPPDKHLVSDYKAGDVSLFIHRKDHEARQVLCGVGMATAAAVYLLETNTERQIRVTIPLGQEPIKTFSKTSVQSEQPVDWKHALSNCCRFEIPREDLSFLYDAAIQSLVLHSPDDAYPGPFTYKRFWFRDAAFMIHAMLSLGMIERAERLIDRFFDRQTSFGYFHSQQGEWDSNGQALWIMNRFCRCAGRPPKASWIRPILKGAGWIIHKRLDFQPTSPHAGLLPVGFSAEHFGPNDYYYWDDFWAVAGLNAAVDMLENTQYTSERMEFKFQSDDFLKTIETSLLTCRERLGRPAMPASPYRRLDSGAVGSLASCYPLGLFKADDERLTDTCRFLMDTCAVNGAFFHDISHSGINPYLSLHLAQSLMRMGDLRFVKLIQTIADLASPTGQWPEAINPRTRTGCMGDGQHVWASAEWIMMMINSFVWEQRDQLILGAGLFPEWLNHENRLSLGTVYTAWGPLDIHITSGLAHITIEWNASWHSTEPMIEVRLPGFQCVTVEEGRTKIQIQRKSQ